MKKQTMKYRIVSVLLAGLLTASLAACTATQPGTATESSTKAPATETSTSITTEAPATEAPTEAPTDAPETEPETEVIPPLSSSGWTVDPNDSSIIYISSEAGLRKLSKDSASVSFENITFRIMTNIDLEGTDWEPIYGSSLDGVVFEGRGHTISGMTINGRPFTEGAETGVTYQLGFIGATQGMVDFKDLTFDHCVINAQGKHCGIIVGENVGGTLTFDNVKVTNSEINGFLKYKEEGGSGLISFRVGGFVGAQLIPGFIDIKNSAVDTLKLSGFHNLASFVGYDGVDSTFLENSSAKNVDMTFSYTYSDNYTVDSVTIDGITANLKFVQVFYIVNGWHDHLTADLEAGNTYENVKYHDYVGGGTYDASEFIGEE